MGERSFVLIHLIRWKQTSKMEENEQVFFAMLVRPSIECNVIFHAYEVTAPQLHNARK